MSEFGGFLNRESEDYEYRDLAKKLEPNIDPPREWGCLIHPDEVRKILHFGNGRFVTVNGDTFENYQIKNWIDQTVMAFGNILNHDIYPRLWRVRPTYGEDSAKIQEELEPFAEYDDYYDYKHSQSNFHFLKLRHRPVYKVHKWELLSPFNNRLLIDLTDKALPNYRTGILRSVYLLPHAVYGLSGMNPAMSIPQYRTMYGLYGQALPGVYKVEYSTGYAHASHVPKEIVENIQKLITVSLASSFGDGVIAGVANYSVSLSGISESVGTTMSATSAFFGARIAQLREEIKEWLAANKLKYAGIQMGVL
ncbi:MAG: hypothetical protein KDK45_23100 [Leptospiraceae bacterium]|nr:hypothetical protein [Leptospiraceae bacterium]